MAIGDNNEEKARKKRYQTRPAQLKQASRGAESLAKGDGSIYTGEAKPITNANRPLADRGNYNTTDNFAWRNRGLNPEQRKRMTTLNTNIEERQKRTPAPSPLAKTPGRLGGTRDRLRDNTLSGRDTANIRSLGGLNVPSRNLSGAPLSAGPSSPMDMDDYAATWAPTNTVTDINAMQEQRVPYQGGMNMRASLNPDRRMPPRSRLAPAGVPLPMGDQGGLRTDKLSPGVDWTEMEGISGISDVYKGTPRHADNIPGYGNVIYSDTPEVNVGTDNRAGAFTLGDRGTGGIGGSRAASAGGSATGRSDGYKYGWSPQRPYEQRMAEGDIFSHGSVGQTHREVQGMRSQARLGTMRGELHPEQAAALYEQANEQEQYLRSMGMEKQKIDTDAYASRASMIKATAASSKLGLDEAELRYKYDKLNSDEKQFNVEMSEKYQIGIGKMLPLYDSFIKSNAYDPSDPTGSFDSWLGTTGLGGYLNKRRDARMHEINRDVYLAQLKAEEER